MPYRHPFKACVDCEATTSVGRCARCNGPVCLQHMPFGGERCQHCESDYRAQLGALQLRRWWWAGFAAVLPLATPMIGPWLGMWRGKIWVWGPLTSALSLLDAAVIVIGGGLLLATLMVRSRVLWLRHQFLHVGQPS
jgi:hypothetical protein